MSELVMIKLTKHFAPNVVGEICSFTPKTAEHILHPKHNGGVEICRFDDTTHRFDTATGKAVALNAPKKAA